MARLPVGPTRGCLAAALVVAVLSGAGGVGAQKLERTGSIVDSSPSAGTSGGNSDAAGAQDGPPKEAAPAETYYQRRYSFPRYPYAKGRSGYLTAQEKIFSIGNDVLLKVHVDPTGETIEDGRELGLETEVGYQYDWAQVHIVDASLRLDTAVGLGFLCGWTGFFEPEGRGGDAGADSMHLVELGGSLRLAATNAVRFALVTSGLVLADRDRAWGGFSGGFAVDVFPVRPLVLSWRYWMGYLKLAGYAGSRLTVGLMAGPVELFAGYGLRVFFSSGDGSVLFHGAIAGLGAWF